MEKNRNLKKKKHLKLGFIGGGINSTIGKIHYIASKLDDNWKLESGFFSRDQKDNIKSAKEFGVPLNRNYNKFELFLKKEKKLLDAVSLITPPETHFYYLKKLLEKNFFVICDKPLVVSSTEIKKIKKIKNYRNLRITYNYTGYPIVRELKKIISKNKLGKIKKILFEMPQDALTNNSRKKIKIKNWRLKDRHLPNICYDLGSHLFNLANFLLLENPSSVFGNYFNSSGIKNIHDNAMIMLKYKSGINGFLWFGKSAVGYRNGLKLRIFGKKGSLTWHQMKPEEFELSKLDGSIIKYDLSSSNLQKNNKECIRYKLGHPSGFIEAFANSYNDISNYYQSIKTDYTFGVNESGDITFLLEKSFESHKKKMWVNV